MRVGGAEEEWASLMRAALGGDASAYRKLLTSLTPVLRGVVRRNCARIGLDGGDAEDVVQEVLLAIHLKRHTWDCDRPIGPWIMTIARNKLIDARRRRGAAVHQPIDEEFTQSWSEERNDEQMDRFDLDRMLEKLGPRQRDLVRALSLEGRSVLETARRLEMKRGRGPRRIAPGDKVAASLYRGEGK